MSNPGKSSVTSKGEKWSVPVRVYFLHGSTDTSLVASLGVQRSLVSLQWYTEEDCVFSQKHGVNARISYCFSSKVRAAK